METQLKQKIAIWMDQSQAIVMEYFPERPIGMEIIDSPIESQVRFEGETSDKTRFTPLLGGGSNQEAKKNHIMENQQKRYFKELKKKLSDGDELLLMGPGIVKNQFFKHLQEDKAFAHLKVWVMDLHKMTTNQLLAKVKGHFEKIE